LPGRVEHVDAVRGERRDQPVDVAPVLGDRVALPQPADATVDLRAGRPREPLPDRASVEHAQCSVAPVNVKASMRSAGTTQPPRKPLSVFRSRPTALTPPIASR